MIQILIGGQTKAELLNNLSAAVEMLASPMADTPDTAPAATEEKPARGRGRPAGSKNKPKAEAEAEPAATAPTKDEVKAACQKAIDTYGQDPVLAVFQTFKAAKLKDVGEKNWPKLLEKLAELDALAGETDDAGGDDFDL